MTIDSHALQQLFLDARSANGFTDRPVPRALMERAYELTRFAPTSMNAQPARYVFLTTPEAKARLMPALSKSNVEKTESAPVTVIVATDTLFHEYMPQIWHRPGAKEMFEGNPAMAEATATRSGTLSGGYFILALRAVGLDAGPMSGFDIGKVNAEFFPDGRLQANFLINVGYADPTKTFERNPRLSFEQAVTVL